MKRLLLILLATGAVSGANAQTTIIRSIGPGGVVLERSVRTGVAVESADPDDPTAAAAPATGSTSAWDRVSTNALPLAQAQQMVQTAMNFDYERTASSYYRAMEERRRRGSQSSAGEEFTWAVLRSDWPAVGRLLKRIPEKDAQKVYNRMLQRLAGGARARDSLFERYEQAKPVTDPSAEPDFEPQTYYYRGNAQREGGIFLSDDFFGVVAAAPAPPDLAQQRLLASLGKVALQGDTGRRSLLERLKAGLPGYDESKPAEAVNIARLLCALGWPELAEPYLPATATELSDAKLEDLLLTADYLSARGAAEKNDDMLRRGWATLKAASAKNAPADQIVERIVGQVPALDDTLVSTGLVALLNQQPALRAPLIVRLSQPATAAGRADSSGDDEDDDSPAAGRMAALRTQSLLMAGLVRTGGTNDSGLDVITGLTWNWLKAAEESRLQAEQDIQRRAREAMYNQRGVSSRSQQRTILAPEEALRTAPDEVVVDILQPGLARQVRLQKFALMLLGGDIDASLAYLRLCCKAYPEESRDLCSHYIAAWVDRRSNALVQEDPDMVRMRQMGYQIPDNRKPGGIALTRALQTRNVREFKDLLGELRKLTPALDPARITWAFLNIHSGAEVYRIEDVEAIFGPPEKMERAELRSLLAAMRVNLAAGWRDMEKQQKSGTNRTADEVKDEVSRGYRVALELLRRGIGFEGGSWEDDIVRGQLCFDAAEFEKDRNMELADYVDLRDKAFASFRHAATNYAAEAVTKSPGQWSIAPFQAWFFVLLGASDLTALNPGRPRDDLGLGALRATLAAMPAPAGPAHRALFGAALTNMIDRVPPQMKQKFLAAGLQALGPDAPEAAGAKATLDYYANLLEEARLRVEIDGSTRVGHGRSFGAFLFLDHTAQLARESGGFQRYLQNQSDQMAMMSGMYVPPGRRAASNHRENFETNVYSALGERFEVQSVTFHDATAKPIRLPREGWQTMPLAYVVLRAKDAAVDRLPSLAIDLDFNDGRGVVLLPALSQVVPLNAADAKPGARPCTNLALAVTLDDREWSKGRLLVEVAAQGNGLIPSLDELCPVGLAGCEREVKDNGVNVSTFQTQDGRSLPQVSRTWQITLLRKTGAAVPAQFTFPALTADFPAATIAYKRAAEADVVPVEAKLALSGVALPKLSPARAVPLPALVAFGAALALGAWWWVRLRRRPAAVEKNSPLEVPAHLTPFTVLAFLRRVAGAKPGDAALRRQIQELERRWFGPSPVTPPEAELRGLAEQWMKQQS